MVQSEEVLSCHLCQREFDDRLKFCPFDGSELIKDIHDHMTGKIFDERYEIILKIGEGGMGSVYKAKQVSTGKAVAIKMVMSQMTENSDIIKRFRREVDLQSKLSHPNLVTALDFSKTASGQYYFVMEYVEGANLRGLLQNEQKLSFEDFFEYMVQVCDGLEYAHSKGIIHRDLKAENVIISCAGHQKIVKILDFGLAKEVGQWEKSKTGSELTVHGLLLGTPAYMSPEQARGQTDKISRRSDIYSLGILMFKLLSGKTPFDSDSPWGILHRHMTETPPSIRKYNSDVPAGLEQIIFRCLEKKPEDRYATVLDLKEDILRNDELIRGDITEDITETVLEMLARIQPSWKKQLKMAIVPMFLLLLSALALFLYQHQEKPASHVSSTSSTNINNVVTAIRGNFSDDNSVAQNKENGKAGNLTETSAPSKEAEQELIDKEIQVAALLELAAIDIENNRLSIPKEDNAIWRYDAVLSIDPAAIEAVTEGRRKIANSYVALATEAMTKNNPARAERYLNKAESLFPGLDTISDPRKSLEQLKNETGNKTETDADNNTVVDAIAGIGKEVAEPDEEAIKRTEINRLVAEADENILSEKFAEAEKLLAQAKKIDSENESLVEAQGRLAKHVDANNLAKKASAALDNGAMGEAVRLINKADSLLPGKPEIQDAQKRYTLLNERYAGMVFVKGGCYQMGDIFGDGEADEKPAHKICLDSFFMDAYEVTQSQYENVIGSNPSHWVDCGGNCPVERVTWVEANSYCKNIGKRLPTEAEWEYAAKAGGKKKKYGIANSILDETSARYKVTEGPNQVGKFAPNALGLYDMAGNVGEWVSDFYDTTYYSKSPVDNPTGPADGVYRVSRGGSWGGSEDNFLRTSARMKILPDFRNYNFGMRCVMNKDF